MNDCRLYCLTLSALMESRITRVRPQRVYDLAINLMPPMSPILMLQLLHYLAASQYLCFCQDRWGNCPAALTALEINDFIKERLQKMYSGKINSPACTRKVSMKMWSKVTSLVKSREVTSHRCDSYAQIVMKRLLFVLLFFMQKWLEEAGWELETLPSIQELCDLQ